MRVVVASALVLVRLAAAQEQPAAVPSAHVVKVGDVVNAEIAKDSPVVHTPTLDKGCTDAPVRGVSFTLELAAGDPVTIELRSYFFDAYLVVRDAKGELVAEDDDGLLRAHSRVVLEPGARTTVATIGVTACALHGGSGPFELRVVKGTPAAVDAQTRREAELDDARAAVQVVEELRGPEHLDVATSLDQLALLLCARGDYEGAQSRYARALAIREKVLGPEHPDTTATLSDLALTLHHQGRYEEARPLYERALAIEEKVLGPDHVAVTTTLDNLGLLLYHEGKYEEARPLFERALAIREKRLGADHVDTATSLNNLALVLQAQGRYEESLHRFERVLAICEQQLGAEHPVTATCLSNVAMSLSHQGRDAEARALLARVLAIREKLFGPEHPDVAASLNNLALVLHRQGQYAEARPLFERALAMREKLFGPQHPDVATSVQNLATLLESQERYDEARPLFERALALCEKTLGPDHPHTAACLDNLALLLCLQEKFEEARPLFARALATWEKTLGPEHPDTATSLQNLAVSLQSQGRYEEARPLFERALAIRQKALGAEHPDTATCLGWLALTRLDLGAPTEAREVATLRLTSARAHTFAEAAHDSAAAALREFASMNEAVETLLSSTAPTERANDSTYAAVLLAKGEAFRTTSRRWRTLVAQSDPDTRATLEQLQSVRAQMSNLFSLREVKDRARHDRDLERLRGERDECETKLAKLVAARPELRPVAPAEVRAALPKDAVLLDFLEHRLYEPAQRQDGKVVKLGRWGERRFSVWISRRDAATATWVDLGPSGAIERAVADFLDGVVGVRGAGAVAKSEDDAARAKRLRELVWAPIAACLDPVTTRRVILCPEGALATLPFGLIVDESGSHLLERHAFAQVEDASSLARPLHAAKAVTGPTAETKHAPSLLVVGAVDYDQSARLEESPPVANERRGSFTFTWNPLSETRREADGVAASHRRRFGDPSSFHELLEDAPSEERLKAELPRHELLHLATHGYYLAEGLRSITDALRDENERAAFETYERRVLVGEWPQFLCGLVCAGANRPQPNRDNGLLTGDEVSGLDLSHCDLAVLSACETALGKPQAGEGVLSLTRSFREAGARTVISSLWQVRDDSTKELMLDFYERLWGDGTHAPQSKLDALRDAQLDMLRKNRERFHGDTKPATWGAFVLTGETE